MKNFSVLLPTILTSAIVVTFFSSGVATGQQDKTSKSNTAESKNVKWAGEKWEYKVIRLEDRPPSATGRAGTSRSAEAELNRLGEEGWELLSVRTDSGAAKTRPIFYLKRPKN